MGQKSTWKFKANVLPKYMFLYSILNNLSAVKTAKLIMADRKFNRAERGKYTLEEKDALG